MVLRDRIAAGCLLFGGVADQELREPRDLLGSSPRPDRSATAA